MKEPKKTTTKALLARVRRLNALCAAFHRELDLVPHLPLLRREGSAYADKISKVMVDLNEASTVLGVALQRMRTEGE